VDPRNIVRGKCKGCNCNSYIKPASGMKCNTCRHTPLHHENIGVIGKCRMRACKTCSTFAPSEDPNECVHCFHGMSKHLTGDNEQENESEEEEKKKIVKQTCAIEQLQRISAENIVQRNISNITRGTAQNQAVLIVLEVDSIIAGKSME